VAVRMAAVTAEETAAGAVDVVEAAVDGVADATAVGADMAVAMADTVVVTAAVAEGTNRGFTRISTDEKQNHRGHGGSQRGRYTLRLPCSLCLDPLPTEILRRSPLSAEELNASGHGVAYNAAVEKV
jgi:hypothetical protein